MTFRDYINSNDFEEVWKMIAVVYHEPEELKPVYKCCYNSLKKFPAHPSIEIMVLHTDKSGGLKVDNVLDPITELIDREVDVRIDTDEWSDEDYMDIEDVSPAEITAHLMYWGNLQCLGMPRFTIKAGLPTEEAVIREAEERNFRPDSLREAYNISETSRKMRFWRETITEDSPRDWSYILEIIKRKLEFNISYFKWSRVTDTWASDVREMETCCRLIDIIINNQFELGDTYVNEKNASRFGVSRTRWKDDFEEEFDKTELYKKKSLQHPLGLYEAAYPRLVGLRMRLW